ncbi:dihydrodipicolinate synthase family protein [Silvibacterium sp.]|uniref:dihydrodipicolinate synthase family protein n=1 Tax=Silvibacterium sp. TaxID=1964179 RepID=UPI0039E3A069
MLLDGIFAAITTPFHADGRLYLHKLEENVEHYSRTPLSGLTVLGSTGEAPMLSDEETRDVLRHARNSASDDKVLIAGIGRESLVETLRLAEFAADHDYDAVLVRTPHYYTPQYASSNGEREDSLGLLTYYRTLADRSPLPVILYSIPKYTHYDLSPALVGELAQHPNILGIKDSSGSVERIEQLVAATANAPKREVTVTTTFEAMTGRMQQVPPPATDNLISADMLTVLPTFTPEAAIPARPSRKKTIGFQVLSGASDQILPSLQAGASGSILGLAACAPQACLEVQMAWKDRDPALAALKQERLVAATKYVVGKLGIPAIKHACDLNGFYGGVPRLPLLPLDAETKAKVADAMRDLRN